MPAISQLTRLPRPAKTLILISVDALIGGVTFWLAALARSGRIPTMPLYYMVAVTGFVMIIVPAIGLACGLYRPVVRFHIPRLSMRAGLVSGLTGCLLAVVGYTGGAAYSQAVGLGTVFALVLFVLLILSRHEARTLLGASTPKGIPVAVYGAGDAGRQLVEVLRRGQERSPVFFIDDDPLIRGRTIEDLPVVSPRDKNFKERLVSKKVQEILLAIPSTSVSRRREILQLLAEHPFHVRSVPGLSELVNSDEPVLDRLKEVSVEELLGRDAVAPLAGLLEKCVKGCTVLVTGGGGSIGSELCRQVLSLGPKRLIVMDHSEFALYQIEQELRDGRGAVSAGNMAFVLGSVTDPLAVAAIVENRGIDTIYHAAAYKHVPIVEENPVEGLRNNVLGTWNVAKAAAKAKVGHFVLISSDKAVRPTNVMGATKRMSELVVQMLSAQSRASTIFSMVRFGNVLESSGSVVPLFRQQIERGGPVTLTHPEVTRYFMTIEEAVQLVIQAGAMASGGEVFVLDMGEPVKIRDLAMKMIRLGGRTVKGDEDGLGDIAIEVTGLRPGEKLFEELLIGGNTASTAHPRIWQAREGAADALEFEKELHSVEMAIRENQQALDVRRLLARWVSGYAGS